MATKAVISSLMTTEPLDTALRDGERVVHATAARIRESGNLARPGWMVVVTNARLLCLRDESGGRRQLELTSPVVRSIRTNSRLLSTKLVVVGASDEITIDGISDSSALALAAAIARVHGEPTSGADHAQRRVLGDEAYESILERLDRIEHEAEELRDQVRFLEAMLTKDSPGVVPGGRE